MMIFCTGEIHADDDNSANCRIDDRRDRPYSLSKNENTNWKKGQGLVFVDTDIFKNFI